MDWWIGGTPKRRTGSKLRIECPWCHQVGTGDVLQTAPANWTGDRAELEPVNDVVFYDGIVRDEGGYPEAYVEERIGGFRICPNPDCRRLIVILYVDDAQFGYEAPGEFDVLTYPHPRPHDVELSDGAPQDLRDAFAEAVTCFEVGAYNAAATMARLTVEIFLTHLESAHGLSQVGHTIFERIKGLRSELGVSDRMLERLEALDSFRRFGNSGTHERPKYEISSESVGAVLTAVARVLNRTFEDDDLVGEVERFKLAKSSGDNAAGSD